VAKKIWPSLPALIEQRWRARFGADEIDVLPRGLQACVDRSTVELPQEFVDVRERSRPFPQRQGRPPRDLPLPVLLSQVLLALALDFERESPTPLALCANAIRVIGDTGIPERDIRRLTGSSPETSGIGWQLEPYIVVGRDPAQARGKLVRLSPLGLDARPRYDRMTVAIETRWRDAFGAARVSALRRALEGVLGAEHGDHPLLSEGLVPPPWHHPVWRRGTSPGPTRRGRGSAKAGARSGRAGRAFRARPVRHAAALSALGHEPRFRSVRHVLNAAFTMAASLGHGKQTRQHVCGQSKSGTSVLRRVRLESWRLSR
jgi:hypothetical protein